MNTVRTDLFIHKEDELKVKLSVIEGTGTFYLEIGDFTIYYPELIKDRLIAELQKIDVKKEEAE